MARALVTGAAGFVGANLVRHLSSAGHDVIAIHRPGLLPWRLGDDVTGSPRVRLRALDLEDAAATERTVRDEAPDWIFHLAAHGAYSWQQDLSRMVAVNVVATRALLDGARAVGAALVNAGSSSEYGYKDHAPSEDELVEPNSEYAVTKVTSTHLCRLAAATHGQRAVTLRLYSVYGPWEEPGRLMPTLVRRALDGELPPLVAPETARDFVWVDDLSAAFVAAATSPLESDPGAVLNIGSGRMTTLKDLVDVVREALGVTAEPHWGSMGQRRWDTDVWVANPARARELLGWRATTSLADGLSAIAAWMRARPEVAQRYVPTA